MLVHRMPLSEPELVQAALDDMRQSGALVSWSRSMRVCASRKGRTPVTDVYRITFARGADASDREGLEALLERHGRTGLRHEVEIQLDDVDTQAVSL